MVVSGTIVAGDMSSHKINYGKHFYRVPIEESTHSTLILGVKITNPIFYNGDHYQQVFGNKTTITMYHGMHLCSNSICIYG